ncbi:sepiapterin reductase-like [Dermacentor andersoni]|uniref:sepiapterin reductase-like n=1 Tax=Dermacentor andersoni TaxID=34620 RepID=UPI002155782F|nr:sepiapterin reductase-like [Dermacentor andersoni]
MAESTGDTASRRTGAFWKRKYYVIITGASVGIGRAVAQAFSQEVSEKSVFVITGRNAENLNETKRLVGQVSPGVEVIAEVMDHSKATFEDYRKLITDTWAKISEADGVVLVHNVGTVGDVHKYASAFTDEKEIDDYFHLNLTSVMTLTSAFLEQFPNSSTISRTIINISSLAAVKPLAGASIYCTGKAARQMYFKIIAAENPSVTVLNYSPGPVDTAMHQALHQGVKEIAAVAEGARESGMLLTPDATALRLVQILGAQEFQSGDHVDYFDRT